MVDAESEQFSLRWNNFHSNLTAGFHALLEGEDLVDVTLAAGGQFVQAHKIVLSVCSPYFKELFKVNPCKHPIVILKDVGHKELVAILHFMYQGEVNVRQDDLATFLKIAEMLQIKGLTGDDSSATNTQQPSVPKSRERTPPPPPQLPLRRERTPPPPPVRREITPPLRQSSALTSIIEPLPVQSEETTVRPFKRMRAEATIVPVPPPPAPMQTPTSSLKVTSPCTVNEDTSGVEFVEITKPKDEPVDYESDIEEVDNKIEPVREDPLVQLLGGESSSQSHQDSSQGATPPIFASIPGLSQDSGGTPEGGQGWHPASCSPFGMTTCMKCPLCARVFVNKFNLKVHIRDVHSLDSGPFSCSQCGKQVKNRSCLRVHIYQQHRKKPSDSILKSKEEISDDSKD